jgi:hypothetical protein
VRRAVALAWAATALVSPGEAAALGLEARAVPPALARVLVDAPCVLSVIPDSPAAPGIVTDPEVALEAPLPPVCLLRARANAWGGIDYVLPGGRTITCRPQPHGLQECW